MTNKNTNASKIKMGVILKNVMEKHSKYMEDITNKALNDKGDGNMNNVVTYDVNQHFLTMDEILVLIEEYNEKAGTLKDRFRHIHDLYAYSRKLEYVQREVNEISGDVLEFKLTGKDVGNDYLGEGELKAIYSAKTGLIKDLVIDYRISLDERLRETWDGEVVLVDNKDEYIQTVKYRETDNELDNDDLKEDDENMKQSIRERINNIREMIADNMDNETRIMLIHELEDIREDLDDKLDDLVANIQDCGGDTDELLNRIDYTNELIDEIEEQINDDDEGLSEEAVKEIKLAVETEIEKKMDEACEQNRAEHGISENTTELAFDTIYDVLVFINHKKDLGWWVKERMENNKIKFIFRATLLNMYFSHSKIEVICEDTDDLPILNMTFYDRHDNEVISIDNDDNEKTHLLTETGEVEMMDRDYDNDIEPYDYPELDSDGNEIVEEEGEIMNIDFSPMTDEEVEERLHEIIEEIEEDENRLSVDIHVNDEVHTLVDQENINILSFDLFGAYVLMNIGLEPVKTFISPEMRSVEDAIITFVGDGINAKQYEMSLRELIDEGLAYWLDYTNEESFRLNPLEYRGLMTMCNIL